MNVYANMIYICLSLAITHTQIKQAMWIRGFFECCCSYIEHIGRLSLLVSAFLYIISQLLKTTEHCCPLFLVFVSDEVGVEIVSGVLRDLMT